RHSAPERARVRRHTAGAETIPYRYSKRARPHLRCHPCGACRRGAQSHAHAPDPQLAALSQACRGAFCWLILCHRLRRREDDRRHKSQTQGGKMMRILLTGAAGTIGTHLRKALKPIYPQLRLSDIKKPADLSADEEFVPAELSRIEEV